MYNTSQDEMNIQHVCQKRWTTHDDKDINLWYESPVKLGTYNDKNGWYKMIMSNTTRKYDSLVCPVKKRHNNK